MSDDNPLTDSRKLPWGVSHIGGEVYLGVVEGKLLTYATNSELITVPLECEPIKRVNSLLVCTEDYKGDFGDIELAEKLIREFLLFTRKQDLGVIRAGAESSLLDDLCKSRTTRDDLHPDLLQFYNV